MKLKKKPLVSIVIPVYNGSEYMREAIDSAINQTYENKEILVINDGSNDDGKTEEIALSYGDKIRYFSKKNGGVSSALNLGISNMKGEYFSWLSHDDVYTLDKVEKQIEALEKLEDKNTIIFCQCMQIDKNSVPFNAQKAVHSQENLLLSWNTVLMELLVKGTFNGCCFLISKNVFDVCGCFDETLRFNQDSLMWYKIFLNKFSIYKISDVCVKSRVHDKQLTQTGQDIFIKDFKAISEFMISELMKISTRNENFIKFYILNNAKYNIKTVVKSAVFEADKKNLLSLADKLKIRIMLMYGVFRPYFRCIYCKFFKNITTR